MKGGFFGVGVGFRQDWDYYFLLGVVFRQEVVTFSEFFNYFRNELVNRLMELTGIMFYLSGSLSTLRELNPIAEHSGGRVSIEAAVDPLCVFCLQ